MQEMVCDEQKRNCKTVYIIYNKPLFSALGVAFTKHGELGVSPISSIANIMSYRFPFLSLGTWLIIWNCALFAAAGIISIEKNYSEKYELDFGPI